MERKLKRVKRVDSKTLPAPPDGKVSRPEKKAESEKRKEAKVQAERVRAHLSNIDRRQMEGLEKDIASICRELEKSGIEFLVADSERTIRETDSSEPPKVISYLLFSDVPALIAKPKNHDEVKKCVQICRKHDRPLVVRGAASSAFGGALPPDGGIVIDTSELSGIISIDRDRLEVTVLGGTRWSDLVLELKKSGLAPRTTPSSIFSTAAGWFSTGGCGINSYRFGDISKSVVKLRVVLPDGTDRYLSPKDKLFDLMRGSEGQLGAITEMVISVRTVPKFSSSILLQVSSDALAFRLISSLTEKDIPISHIMFFDEGRTRELNELTPIPGKPLHESPAILLHTETDDISELRFDIPSEIGAIEIPPFMANLLWNDRYFPMRGRARGPGMLGAEVVLPISVVPSYLEKARSIGSMFGVRLASEAHIISKSEALVMSFYLTDQRRSLMYTMHAVLSLLLTRVATDIGGRPYAVGIWNQPFVRFVIPRDRMAELKKVNRQLDPKDLFNPGKFLSKRAKLTGAFGVFLKERLSLFALSSLLAAASLVGRITRGIFAGGKSKEISDLELSALACARCGACVNVCPAFLVTGREAVTARGKLLLYRRIKEGVAVSQDEASALFLCIKCHACEEVCQTRLPLISAYEELEDFIEERFGRPKKLIERFVAEVEASQEYERLLYEGTISPDAGVMEAETDAV
ncbi:MAG: FAD-binding protein [Thermoplasmata archaeon]